MVNWALNEITGGSSQRQRYRREQTDCAARTGYGYVDKMFSIPRRELTFHSGQGSYHTVAAARLPRSR